IEMVSSTDGWSTVTGWKRRSRAASFSICLRYSSRVVAPMQCSSPRASIGLSRLPASMAPSALPAPTTVCNSSMKRMTRPFAPVLRAGDQGTHVHRNDSLVLQTFGHVAADDSQCQTFDDGGLADARFAD